MTIHTKLTLQNSPPFLYPNPSHLPFSLLLQKVQGMNIQRVTRTPNCHHCNDSEISPFILYSFINHPSNFSTNSTTTCATPQPCTPNSINRNPSLFRSHHSGLIVPPDDGCVDLVSPSFNTSSEGSFSSFQAENLHHLLDSLDDLPHYSVFQNNSFRDKNVQVPECFSDDQLHHDHILDEMLKTSVGSTPAPKTVDLDHKDINEKTTTTTTDYKQRIRWTTELHDLFLDAIQTLGGPQYATPKKILGIMNVKGLSIYHVKSHLQKYRLAKNVPDLRHEKRGSTSCTENKLTYDNIDAHINSDNMPVTEALRMQLQLQKLLHDQLKSQKDLQVRIEENGELLRKLIEKQNNTNQSLTKADDRSTPSDSIANEFSSSQPSASD